MTGNAKLVHRIIVQRGTVIPNNLNEGQITWEQVYQCWADFRDVSTREKLRAQEVQADLDSRFTIRWTTDAATITATDRIIFGGRTFQIIGVKEKERNRWLEIDCKVRNDAAMLSGDASP